MGWSILTRQKKCPVHPMACLVSPVPSMSDDKFNLRVSPGTNTLAVLSLQMMKQHREAGHPAQVHTAHLQGRWNLTREYTQ